MRPAVIAVVLAACGDGRVAPDATPIDAGDRVGLVSVQVLTNDLSAGRYEVYFQNADSSLVLATRTLDDGSANAFMAAGGFVTVGTSNTLWTFSDVQVGDHLIIDQRPQFGSSQQTTFRLRLPPEPRATSIQLQTTCGLTDATAAQSVALLIGLGNCAPGLDMLALAYGDPGPISYLYRDSVAIAPTVTLDAPYRPIETSTIEVTNAPFAGVRTLQTVFGTHGALYSTFPFGQATDGRLSLSTPMPLPPGTRVMTDASSLDFTQAYVQHVVRWDPVGPLTQLDLSEQVHPLTSQPRFEPTSSTIRWTEDPSGLTPNAALVAMSFDFTNSWWIAGPRGADPVIRVPVLPGTAHQPHSEIGVFQLINIADDGGYAQVREQLAGWQLGQPWPITGDSGHVVYETLSGLGPID